MIELTVPSLHIKCLTVFTRKLLVQIYILCYSKLFVLCITAAYAGFPFKVISFYLDLLKIFFCLQTTRVALCKFTAQERGPLLANRCVLLATAGNTQAGRTAAVNGVATRRHSTHTDNANTRPCMLAACQEQMASFLYHLLYQI